MNKILYLQLYHFLTNVIEDTNPIAINTQKTDIGK